MELGTHAGKMGFLIFLLIFVALEALWLIYRRGEAYPWQDSAASFGVAFVKRLVDAATAGIAGALLFWVYDHRIATLDIDSLWMLLLAFLAVEFFYYWHHRFAHEIRWLWATHGVHHTAPYMNLSVAGRLGWTGLLSGTVLFFAPLAYIGFHPVAILLLLAASLFYQIWIHTELVGQLGLLEGI
ncbi:MAG: sterol desaturase family protein, partial [Pseudomonadales bacterium]|nr:sterol desaturase family protein [Pseudomonadales bacterium]